MSAFNFVVLPAVFACSTYTAFAQHHSENAAVPASPQSNGGERSTAPKVGHHFIEPPPVPDRTAPEWVRGSSADDHAYTLGELLILATRHNPTLIQSQLHVNAELARAMQAGLYPNPTVSYIGEQIGLSNTAGEWQGAEVEQRFVTADKLALSRNKYLQRAKVAEHLAVAQQFRVCNDVRIHFVKSLAAMQVLALQRELLKTSEDCVLTVREMYNLGQANRADAQRAIAMLQHRRLKVMQAENLLRRHLLELAAIVGLEMLDPVLEGSIAADRSLIDFDSACARILQSSPELLAAHAKLREDCITLNRETVEWIPDIVASAGPGYNSVDRETTLAARVSIEIPLFDRNQGTVAQAQADYIRQRQEIRRTQLDLRRRLATEYDRYLSAYQHTLEYDSVILPAKREAYRLVLESYKDNRAEWPDVLHAQEEFTTARIEYIDQRQTQRVSEILIDGFLLHDGLMSAEGPVPRGHIDSVPKPR